MEPIADTVDRVMAIWSNAEDKTAFLDSLGFEDREGYLLWINRVVSQNFIEAQVYYLEKILMSDEFSPNLEVNAEAAKSMALADLAICFMLLGKERERVERSEHG